MTPQQQAMAALDAVDAGDLDTAYAIARRLPRAPRPPFRLDAGWRDQAACQGLDGAYDADIFDTRGKRAGRFIADYCRGCPVIAECFEAGRDERHGVWGGIWHGGDK